MKNHFAMGPNVGNNVSGLFQNRDWSEGWPDRAQPGPAGGGRGAWREAGDGLHAASGAKSHPRRAVVSASSASYEAPQSYNKVTTCVFATAPRATPGSTVAHIRRSQRVGTPSITPGGPGGPGTGGGLSCGLSDTRTKDKILANSPGPGLRARPFRAPLGDRHKATHG